MPPGDTLPDAASGTPWQQCQALTNDPAARLACFDQWAALQAPAPPAAQPGNPAFASTTPVPTSGASGSTLSAPPALSDPVIHDCASSRYSGLSRFWELEAGTDCGTFDIRGYRPISLSWIGSTSVNTQPTSKAPDHTASTAQPYSTSETRIQLSVRTKIIQGVLTGGQDPLRDSLWFGYSQQSYWQLFNGDLSRPFRSTDHEPEFTYIYPSAAQLPLGWKLRYTGFSVVHQSNGQSLPLSRSWNRTVLLAGLEKDNKYTLQARVWRRLNENAPDDDNPDISNLVGRAELSGSWQLNPDNTLGFTLRHALRANANGSTRLDWYRSLGSGGQADGKSGLRFHTQLFTGYGDSMVDYNRRRTVLSLGLSLVDW